MNGNFLDLSYGNISEKEFNTYLSKFLYSKDGSKFSPNFRFEHDLKCGSPAPKILVLLL